VDRQGFLNLNKPAGFTSHDCVGRLRRLLGLRRIGHGGTLDPMATGVLPIALGPATRLLQFLPTAKTYRASIRFGLSTTTDDITGTQITASPVPELQLEQIKSALPKFQGQIQQLPPDYSAIQVQGQRLYDLARQGKEIKVSARTVEIDQINILDWRAGDFPELDLEITCGPGTYIRAIARDLGVILSCGGTLASLTRTLSCGMPLAQSLSFEELAAQIQADAFCPLEAGIALADLPLLTLDPDLAWRWGCGQKIAVSDFGSDLDLEPDLELGLGTEIEATSLPPIFRIHSSTGEFLGISEQISGRLVPKVVYSVPERSLPLSTSS
jgi:tRNA pseudouridine55 synthase